MKRILSVLLCIVLLATMPAALAETTLQVGSKGEAVQVLQQKLIQLGFLSGTADGAFGQQTQLAVQEMQTMLVRRGYKVEVNGIVDATFVELLYNADCLIALQTLSKGDKGGPVRRLQSRLVEIGYLMGAADGDFGKMTEEALMACQQGLIDAGAEGISVTGVFDTRTREVLYGDLSGLKLITPVYYSSENPEDLQDGYLYAESAILIRAETGEMLYGKDADKKMYPASTTKIMTLLLALENFDPDEMVTLPASTDDIPFDSSRVPVFAGEKMPMRDLLYGLMIRSGNDAANAIATLVAGSTEAFVEMMNQRARELGMNSTHFANPHGYHSEDHYTTARDMAILTRFALSNADFMQIASTRTYTMQANDRRGALTLTNNYSILTPGSTYYYRNAFGVKTGYTSFAGQCYVGAARNGDDTLISVVFNSGISKVSKWEDTARLFDYGFAMLDAA